MPEVHPRGNTLVFDADLNTFVEGPGLQMQCTTIAELLDQVERETGAYVVPHDPPKYFRYHVARENPDFLLIDIHVYRGEEEICIKQDLSFVLFPRDKVVFGHLGC